MEEKSSVETPAGEAGRPPAKVVSGEPMPRQRRPVSLGWWVVATFMVLLIVFGVRACLGVEVFFRQALDLPGRVVSEWKQAFPDPTPTIVVLPPALENVRSLARLETSSYFLSTVVEARRPPSWPGTGQRLLLVAHGKVIAGIDLSQIQETDVQVIDRRVIVHLPAAEVFDAYLLEDRTHVYDYDLGIFARYDVTLEEEARRQALAEFRSTALEYGILEDARQRAEWEIQRLLLLLGYEVVSFR